MEGQTKFQTALKKTVVMFKTLTGKDLTEEEGSIFINLLDMTEGYLTNGEQKGDKSEAKALVKLVKEAMVAEPVQFKAADEPKGGIEIKNAACRWPNMQAQASSESLFRVGYEISDSECSSADAKPGKSYVVPPITTNKRDHIQGYDWQIVVLSREKDASDSYVIHFPNQPTQEQLEEHFAKFVARTHYVHVNEWHRGDREWVGITNIKYDTAHLLKAEHDPRWEQDDMAYRIRYYDRETGALTFKYVPRKPSGSEMATYHHIKGFATVQSKVA